MPCHLPTFSPRRSQLELPQVEDPISQHQQHQHQQLLTMAHSPLSTSLALKYTCSMYNGCSSCIREFSSSCPSSSAGPSALLTLNTSNKHTSTHSPGLAM
eukprot:748761-Hanusia_phi.AAC.1